MPEQQTQTITLTREQQLAVLATTGLMVTTLEIGAGEADADGAVTARVPLPHWLATETNAR